MNRQLEYYRDSGVTPVAYASEEGLKSLHFLQRRNLLENHLGIPLKILDGAKVLEFGPCGGENALLLAIQGANVTLVEPNINMHSVIRENFTKNECQVSIRGETLESFTSLEQYDFVIAEGFLHAIPHRKQLFKKLFQLSSKMVLMTYSCAYGSFYESLKLFLFRRLLDILSNGNPDNIEFNKKIEWASRLYAEDFNKLKTARTFESWVEDILIQPYQTSGTLDNFADLEQGCSELGFSIYGCSPCWDMRHTHRWYKDVSSRSLVEEWRDNLSFIITGKKNMQLEEQDIEILYRITPLMLDYSCDRRIALLSDILELSQQLSTQFSNLNNLFLTATADNAEEVVKIYHQSSNYKLWGMPHHYLALVRRN